MELKAAVLASRKREIPLKPSLIIFGIQAEIRKAYLPDGGKVCCSLICPGNDFVLSSVWKELAVGQYL